MIDVREAIHRARDFLQDIYAPQPLEALMLEEVQSTKDAWLITLGFNKPKPEPMTVPNLNLMRDGPYGPQDRMYKRIKVDRNTGVVDSMRIRTVH